MKKFFTIVLGSFVGAWIALMISSILSVVLSFAMFGLMQKSSASKTSVSEHSILYLDLGTQISERKSDSDVMSMLLNQRTSSVGLDQMLAAIDAAKTNNKIDGILIDCKGVSAGITTLYELRNAIENFKTSKKFVYAYGYEGIAQADYYVASAADSIFVNPEVMVDIHGLAAQNMFFKKLLDKVGVEMQVIRVGTFKSAVEPYMLTEISEANRMQQEHYMGSIWKTMVADMSKSRKIAPERLNEIADSLLIAKDVNYLLANNIVDGVFYKPEMEAKLKAKTVGSDKDKDLNLVSVQNMPVKQKRGSGDKLAVVYAEGEIDGNEEGGIDSEELVEVIEDLADDDDVKAMVLRVNSPGGSAFGSEQIWKAVEDFKAKNKKVAVSMGDLAASGGYYISCGADRIFAQPVTITGSIGIFGVIPCAETLVTEKLGVTQSVVKTNANGDFGSIITKLTPQQRDAMQAYVNRGYELFTSRCAAGRAVSQDSIKQIAEGRVWDGNTAKKIGLVDEFGSLADAVKWVAKESKMKDYNVETYPATKTRIEKMMENFATKMYEDRMHADLGEIYDYHKVLKKILGRQRVLCLMETVVVE